MQPKPAKNFELEHMVQRINAMRRDVLKMIYGAGSGHPGGSLSCVDLIACLAEFELEWGRRNPGDPHRNRFVLSKGHACPSLYAAAAAWGLIESESLAGFRKLGHDLQGHPHIGTTPWAETSTGSLGQGFSVAIGMAIGLRYQKNMARVYVLLGDGELQEGEVWEGAMCAGHNGLDNLCAILDYNKLQSDARNEEIMGIEPLREKWESFNWVVDEVDGHDLAAIAGALARARECTGVPVLIIAHTVKGKGVSFMENSPAWHGSVKLRDDEFSRALRDLGATEPEITNYIAGVG